MSQQPVMPLIHVHPTAVVDPTVRLGMGVVIGPNVRIGPYAVIGCYSVIGSPPEHREYAEDYALEKTKGVVIGERVRISEFVTIHAGTKSPTLIRKNAMILHHSHIAHDCILADECLVDASLAGHTYIGHRAIIAGHGMTHQWATIGPWGFLSPQSFLKAHIPPGELFIGNPARPAGLNEVGLKRSGFLKVEDIPKEIVDEWIFHKDRSKLCIGKS